MSGRFEQKTHETLLKLLKVKSLDSISATDITSDLELTKQAFYYHAKNVPEYICGQIRKHVKEMTSDCGNNINKLLPAAEQGMHYFRANRIIMDGIMKSEKRDMYLNCLYDSIRKELCHIGQASFFALKSFRQILGPDGGIGQTFSGLSHYMGRGKKPYADCCRKGEKHNCHY